MKHSLLLAAFALMHLVPNLSAQCLPELLNCSTQPSVECDLTANDPLYWNDIFWWDITHQIHDLSETAVDLTLAVRDTCPDGGIVEARCLLYLDLNLDGVYETVIDSDNPPGPGLVHYNNIANPNFEGGTPRLFDQRPIDSLSKWRFNLLKTVTGDTTTFSLRWASPAGESIPQLPLGFQKVRWMVRNNAGAQTNCEKSFLIKDCKAPTVVCLNGLSANIMPTEMVTLWASDFLQFAEDNVTSTGLLRYGIRKSGTGTGFPVDPNGNPMSSVTFNCDEVGMQGVELWAIDLTGNADYCTTDLLIQDNLGNCIVGGQIYTSCARFHCNPGPGNMEEVTFLYDSSVMPSGYNLSESDGCGVLHIALPPNSLLTITPQKDDNPLLAVNTWDLVILDDIIDGNATFTSPYQWIAADANRDNVINAQDIVECQKLILGISPELAHNTSWRFVPADYVFPSPNPLSQPYPESITVNTSEAPPASLDFIGVKICDVSSCGLLTGFFEHEAENQHLIGEAEPNPTAGDAVIPVQLLEQAPVMLEVYDLSGRLCYRQENMYPAGGIIVPVPASAMPQAGMYLWTMRAGEVTKTGKLLRY